MRLESVTRFVASRSAALRSGSEAALVPVSLPRVSILERGPDDARPVWKGRPAIDGQPAPLVRASPTPKLIARRAAVVVTPPADPAPAPAPELDVIDLPRFLPPRLGGPIPRAQMVYIAASVSGVSVDAIKSAIRVRPVVRARWLAIYLLRTINLLSYPAIGQALGGRDHSTICHAIGRIEQAIGDRQFPTDLHDRAVAAWEIIRGIK